MILLFLGKYGMKLRFYFTIGLLFLFAGLLLDSQRFIQYWQVKEPMTQTSGVVEAAAKTSAPKATDNGSASQAHMLVSGVPKHISLPRLGISLDIKPGYYNKASQTWTLSNTNAHFATVTAPANNQSGNTFIYGHNKETVFKNLSNIKPGDTAIITTTNNLTFTYVFSGQRTTNPNDVSLFAYTGKPILTLQTCSGVFYQNRQLFTFNFTGVQ